MNGLANAFQPLETRAQFRRAGRLPFFPMMLIISPQTSGGMVTKLPAGELSTATESKSARGGDIKVGKEETLCTESFRWASGNKNKQWWIQTLIGTRRKRHMLEPIKGLGVHKRKKIYKTWLFERKSDRRRGDTIRKRSRFKMEAL
jgi:hypothetical protein